LLPLADTMLIVTAPTGTAQVSTHTTQTRMHKHHSGRLFVQSVNHHHTHSTTAYAVTCLPTQAGPLPFSLCFGVHLVKDCCIFHSIWKI
jgi:hypothetical protein